MAPYSASYGRSLVSTVLHAPQGGEEYVGRTLRFGGWVRTGREAGGGSFAFVDLNDGSCFESLQVMIEAPVAEAALANAGLPEAERKTSPLRHIIPTSTAILVEGVLAATPPGTKQKVRSKGEGDAAAALREGWTKGRTIPKRPLLLPVLPPPSPHVFRVPCKRLPRTSGGREWSPSGSPQ